MGSHSLESVSGAESTTASAEGWPVAD
jgi:hypothetical protein